MYVIQFCKHTGSIKVEVIELKLNSSEFRRVTEHRVITIGGTIYTRNEKELSVYFATPVLDLTAHVDVSDLK